MGNNNKSIYSGLDWALTERARELIASWQAKNHIEYDLAVAMLNEAIEAGLLKESDVYSLEQDNT
jgi:hypothetical protein